MLRIITLLFIAVLLVSSVPLIAQEAAELPPSVKLDGLMRVWQDFNRCSAAAFTMLISYHDGWEGTYTDVMRWLNPNSEDVSVRLEEMVDYAEFEGLKGIIRTGGDVDILRAVVAAGFPLLIENNYFDGGGGWNDWMSHNRVVMGYDDELRVLYTYDSLLGHGENGEGRPISYDDIMERWKPFNYNYLVLYEPEQEETLKAALGDQWDTTYNAEWTLARAEEELAGNAADSFSLFNKSSALVALGKYEEAAQAFDEAKTIGLPWRMLWYQYAPFEAYLQVGRYDDTINLAKGVIANTPNVEEMYYYIARAAEGLGDTDRAIANYEAAIFRNSHFIEATTALSDLKG